MLETQTGNAQKELKTIHDPKDQCVGKTTAKVCSHFYLYNTCAKYAFSSKIEPKYLKEDELDKCWILEDKTGLKEIRFEIKVLHSIIIQLLQLNGYIKLNWMKGVT